jgi:hypothetical protein
MIVPIAVSRNTGATASWMVRLIVEDVRVEDWHGADSTSAP